MGESVTEGSIVEWRVKPGQWIDAGETLVDVTTDKVDVEVPAPAPGVVKAVPAAEGAPVPVGSALAEIDTAAPKPSGGGDGATGAAAPNGVQTTKPAPRNGQRAGAAAPLPAVLRPADAPQVAGTGVGASAPSRAAPLPPFPADAKPTPLKGPVAS